MPNTFLAIKRGTVLRQRVILTGKEKEKYGRRRDRNIPPSLERLPLLLTIVSPYLHYNLARGEPLEINLIPQGRCGKQPGWMSIHGVEDSYVGFFMGRGGDSTVENGTEHATFLAMPSDPYARIMARKVPEARAKAGSSAPAAAIWRIIGIIIRFGFCGIFAPNRTRRPRARSRFREGLPYCRSLVFGALFLNVQDYSVTWEPWNARLGPQKLR